MAARRFDRFLPLTGVIAGLLFAIAFFVDRNDPGNETGPAKTLAYWQDGRGVHQLVGILLLPLIAFLLLFFGAGLKLRLDQRPLGERGSYGSVALGGMVVAAAAFAFVGMLEAAMTSAAHDGQRQAVYTLNQFHSYDWLAWNPAFAAALLSTGLGLRGTGALPTPVIWATIVIGASLLTPLGFFGFILIPLWLIVAGVLIFRRTDLNDSAAASVAVAPS
jgi:hypothetical protein